MPTAKGADRTVKPKAGPLCSAYDAWIACAKKGETHVAFVGAPMDRIAQPPEQRMTKAERQVYEAKRKKARETAKKNGTKPIYPSLPEPYKRIRPDVMALQERIEAHELKGLIGLKVIVRGALRHYECIMLVQRNGLAAVRARESEKFQ